MEKYFYILVAVIWVVSSLFKKKQVPKTSLPPFDPNAKTEGGERTIETIFKEMLTGQKEAASPPKTKTVPIEKRGKKKIKESIPSKKRISSIDKPVITQTILKQEEEENTIDIDKESILSSIDLKKAIIYSEIINRPKYLDC